MYVPEKYPNSNLEPSETSISLRFPTIFLRFLYRITSISYIHFSIIDVYLL
jgi:hypothetical protein